MFVIRHGNIPDGTPVFSLASAETKVELAVVSVAGMFVPGCSSISVSVYFSDDIQHQLIEWIFSNSALRMQADTKDDVCNVRLTKVGAPYLTDNGRSADRAFDITLSLPYQVSQEL